MMLKKITLTTMYYKQTKEYKRKGNIKNRTKKEGIRGEKTHTNDQTVLS